jgi:hypothetical protein
MHGNAYHEFFDETLMKAAWLEFYPGRLGSTFKRAGSAWMGIGATRSARPYF